MPGTFGSVVGVFLFWLMRDLNVRVYVLTVFAFLFFSVWISSLAEQYLGEKDSQKIVIDEIAGIFVTMFWIPFSWKAALVGFILFRAFDIGKPFPVKFFQDKLPSGWGVVGDDVMAGIYANLLLQAARHFGVI